MANNQTRRKNNKQSSKNTNSSFTSRIFYQTVARNLTLAIFILIFASLGVYLISQGHADSISTPQFINGGSAPGTWCMNDYFGGTASPTALNVTGCNGVAGEQWYYSGGRIINTELPGTHCVQPRDGGTTQNTQVVSDECDGHASQNWTPYQGGFESTETANTNKMCLALPQGDTSALLALEPCAAYKDQNWTTNKSFTCGSGNEASPGTSQCIAVQLMSEPPYNWYPGTRSSADGRSMTYWQCLQALWTQESSWRWNADNSSSGAYGIPQSLPADKMASAGADWRTDTTTQIRWGLSYIKSTYGNTCNAETHELVYHWYGIDSNTNAVF